MPVTQKQIAERLGVSQVLVSHALNDYESIAKETRQRIQQEARRMGYHRHSNRAARELIARRYGKRARSGIIALMLPGPGYGDPLLVQPYFTPFFIGLHEEANRREIDIFSCTLHGGRLPNLVAEGGVDGIILLTGDAQLYEQANQLELPSIVAGGPSLGSHLHVDDKAGTTLTTRHLIELGHKRIAYLGQTDSFETATLRVDGYRDELTAHGIKVDKKLIEATLPGVSFETATEGARRLLERSRDFTALVCYNDMIAMAAVRALEEIGLRVPDDVSVTGFDDISYEFKFQPELTSIAFDRRGMGRRAVQWICETVEQAASNEPESKEAKPKHIAEKFGVELMVRDSTKPPSPSTKKNRQD